MTSTHSVLFLSFEILYSTSIDVGVVLASNALTYDAVAVFTQ